MKHKFLLIILSLFLIGSAPAKDNVVGERHGTKAIFDDAEPISSIQIRRGDKGGPVIFDVYVSDDDGIPQPYFNRNNMNEVWIWVDYSASSNVDVRFHFTITGPMFFTTYTTDWYTARYNNADWVAIYWTNPHTFSPGTHLVNVSIEVDGNRSLADGGRYSLFRAR